MTDGRLSGKTAIAPGYVQTESITILTAEGTVDADKLARRTPKGRIGNPEEIGEVAQSS